MLLECRDITLGYENITLAEGVSFTVNEGEYWCITGENGSGKTTLMKTVLGLREPLSGEVIYGQDMKGRIGYLPQQTAVQRDFPASVKEVVYSGFAGQGGFFPFITKEQKQMAAKNMERMGILNLAGSSYRELSGGQQQRVLLSRALCATQKLILLDEPVAGLDIKVAYEMYELIQSLNRDLGIAVIMITHDPDAIRFASHELTFTGKRGKEEVIVKCLRP